MTNIRWPLRMRNLLFVMAFAIPSLLLMLTGIYYLQYGAMLSGAWSLPDALSLSYFRVFVATYDGLLKYLTLYPDGDVGIAGFSLMASLLGIEERNLDLEVAFHFLGSVRGRYTSFPTSFIGNAYASFVYVGVVVYSLAVALVM